RSSASPVEFSPTWEPHAKLVASTGIRATHVRAFIRDAPSNGLKLDRSWNAGKLRTSREHFVGEPRLSEPTGRTSRLAATVPTGALVRTWTPNDSYARTDWNVSHAASCTSKWRDHQPAYELSR